MKTYLVRGVPASIQLDGWWMDGTVLRQPQRDADQARPRPGYRAALLGALIALADLLLWQVTPALSLAVLGLCVLLVALGLTGARSWGGPVLASVFFLPLIEQVQPLSVLFWVVGMILGGSWIALGGWRGLQRLEQGALQLMALAPRRLWDDLTRMRRVNSVRRTPDRLRSAIRGWALPAGLGVIFLSLLIEANPLIGFWWNRVEPVQLPEVSRVLFWAGVALVVWPLLTLPALDAQHDPGQPHALIGPRRLPHVINAGAVRRALILFNLMFALQTGIDATFLWAGARLPDGMSYAGYAHRGAYPLLFTALLAGLFALVARPYGQSDRLVRLALLAFVVQTLLLVASSVLRLELYVGAYGLTRLRLAAAIWMGLVAVWLAMILWQIVQDRSAGWLIRQGVRLGAAVVYGCMFLSFDATIAQYNLTHPGKRDIGYICRLGAAALPAIARYEQRHGEPLCLQHYAPRRPDIQDWREWGFRDWRVLRSLDAIQTAGAKI